MRSIMSHDSTQQCQQWAAAPDSLRCSGLVKNFLRLIKNTCGMCVLVTKPLFPVAASLRKQALFALVL